MRNKDRASLSEAEENILKKLDEARIDAKARFPLLTALFATFGFVLLLAGFQKIIDRIDFFGDNPWLLLVTGLLILAITGTVYKKLD